MLDSRDFSGELFMLKMSDKWLDEITKELVDFVVLFYLMIFFQHNYIVSDFCNKTLIVK